MGTLRNAASGLGRGWLPGLVLVAAASATTWAGFVVTGQILYGKAEGATRAAVADVQLIYDSNPAYMRMKAFGLSESNPRGRKLFQEAVDNANKALAFVAQSRRLELITVIGGIEGGDEPIPDVTSEVTDALPLYCIEGNVLYGQATVARSLAQLDSMTVLSAIPAWQESQALTEADARYHILRKTYLDAFAAAIRKVARDLALDVIVERDGATCRTGPVADVTARTIEALDR